MGGTLEDIWVDDESEKNAIDRLYDMLSGWGFKPSDKERLKQEVDKGWEEYAVYRERANEELKPIRIWCDYALKYQGFPREKLAEHAEEIAHMWEITHYHRRLRPRVEQMLQGLKDLGLKLSVVSNTASIYQVFDTLEEYGIRDYFQDVTLSSVTGLRKPCADIFKVALRQTRSEANQSVYVGDTVSRDINGSKGCGFALAIQISSKLTKEKDVGLKNAFAADYHIDDIYDVYTLLKGLTE